jgi:hypothetical protein
VAVEKLCTLGVPVIDDIGSGALAEGLPQLADEPPVRRSVAAGCAVVGFSGERLLGGPQAGLMVGTGEAIERCAGHPLARAVRIDKLSLAALEATLRLYLEPAAARRELPVLRMLAADRDELRARAEVMRSALSGAGVQAEVVDAAAKVGRRAAAARASGTGLRRRPGAACGRRARRPPARGRAGGRGTGAPGQAAARPADARPCRGGAGGGGGDRGAAGMSAAPLVLGTAGHVDHGKTTLVRALTGRDTDRLAEEKARGLSIELGYAPLELPSGRTLSVVDVPGHERFVRTMVAGTTGIDLFLLCVAADDGVMPQTREPSPGPATGSTRASSCATGCARCDAASAYTCITAHARRRRGSSRSMTCGSSAARRRSWWRAATGSCCAGSRRPTRSAAASWSTPPHAKSRHPRGPSGVDRRRRRSRARTPCGWRGCCATTASVRGPTRSSPPPPGLTRAPLHSSSGCSSAPAGWCASDGTYTSIRTASAARGPSGGRVRA